MQFTDDRESSSSVGVIDLILAAAHGWQLDGDRKRVWAQLMCTAAGPNDRVAG